MFGISWEHFGPVCLLLILGSQALNRRAQRIRWRKEVRSLGAALRIGLRSLHSVYSTNLQAIRQDKRNLESGRHQIALLKTQLNRLAVLDQAAVEAVMSACIAVERAESTLGSVRKAMDPATQLPYQRDVRKARAVAALQEACTLLESAEALLSRGTENGRGIKVMADGPTSRATDRPHERDAGDHAVRLKATSP